MSEQPSANRRISRPLWWVAGLFGALLVFSIWLDQPQPVRPYDLDSTDPNGLRALRLWLAEMDYRVTRGEPDAAVLFDGEQLRTHLLFIYPNAVALNDAEVAAIRRWVEAGGVLVTIGTSLDEAALVDAFGVHASDDVWTLRSERLVQPLLPAAYAPNESMGLARVLDIEGAPRAVPVLALGENGAVSGRATVAVQPVGDGWVWHLTTRHDLSNAALRDDATAQIVPALLRTVPENGMILFDTYHLYGEAAAESLPIASLWEWLHRTQMGRAVLFGALLLFAFLIISGRRLGPPLPMVTASRPRAAAEYVMAMARLQQRAKQSGAVAHYHRERLKRALGKNLHIAPTLADEAFMAQLRNADHRLEPHMLDEATETLQMLQGEPNENDLVQAVRRVDELLQQLR